MFLTEKKQRISQTALEKDSKIESLKMIKFFTFRLHKKKKKKKKKRLNTEIIMYRQIFQIPKFP